MMKVMAAHRQKKQRRQFEINHRKWIDAAAYLGCHAIRTNCRGPQGVSKEEALKYAAETYQMMMEYAVPAKISVLIENHGGVSNDADWMVSLMKEVNNLYFGSYPDWRQPSDNFDNVDYLVKDASLCRRYVIPQPANRRTDSKNDPHRKRRRIPRMVRD